MPLPAACRSAICRSARLNAKAPFAKGQAPYFYRFNHGKMQATVVSDGPLPLGEPSGTFLGVSKEEVGKMLADNFLSTSNVVLEQNSLVLNTGDRLVLFDTGMGSSTMFGKTTGRLLESLRAAGIDPGTIDAIVVTHAHIDHIGGMVDAANKRLFPNAQVYIGQTDFDFWTDEKKLGRRHQGFRRPRPQEPAALPRPHRLLQGRPGVPAGHPGHGGAGAHGRAHRVHDHLRRQDACATSAT